MYCSIHIIPALKVHSYQTNPSLPVGEVTVFLRYQQPDSKTNEVEWQMHEKQAYKYHIFPQESSELFHMLETTAKIKLID